MRTIRAILSIAVTFVLVVATTEGTVKPARALAASPPTDCVTRAQFVRAFDEVAGILPNASLAPDFTDVAKSLPYFGYIEAAHQDQIIAGFPDGTFHPGACMTVIAAAKMEVGALGDGNLLATGRNVLDEAVSLGLLDRTLRPYASLSAAEEADMLAQFAKVAAAQQGGTKTSPPWVIPSAEIETFFAAPQEVGFTGGPVTLTWSVLGASTCTLSSEPAVDGLPTTVACSNASGSLGLTLPPNTSDVVGLTSQSYTFTLTATGAAGTSPVQKTTSVTVSSAFVSPSATPARVTSLEPDSGVVGDTVTLRGQGLDGYVSVQFGGAEASVQSWSGTSMTVIVPAPRNVSPDGTVGVTVGSLHPTGGVTFTYAGPRVDAAASPNPSAGPTNGEVTIRGSDFGAPAPLADRVYFGSSPATIVQWTNTSITAVAPMDYGTGLDQKLANDIGISALECLASLPLAEEEALTPASRLLLACVGGPLADSDQSLSVTLAQWVGMVSHASSYIGRRVPITVQTEFGTSNPAEFTYTGGSASTAQSAPEISGINPNPVQGTNSDQLVTIEGSGFAQGAEVTLVTLGQAYQIPSSQIVSVTSSAIEMSIDVTTQAAPWTAQVTNPDGQTSNVVSFEVTAPAVQSSPEISGINPNPVQGTNSDQLVTIDGSGFAQGAEVTLVTLGQAYQIPSSQIVSVTPSAIEMSIDVTTQAAPWTAQVTNPDGQTSNVASFEVQ